MMEGDIVSAWTEVREFAAQVLRHRMIRKIERPRGARDRIEFS